MLLINKLYSGGMLIQELIEEYTVEEYLKLLGTKEVNKKRINITNIQEFVNNANSN